LQILSFFYQISVNFTLFFIIYLIWAQWQLAYGPKPEPVAESSSTAQVNNENGIVPQAASLPKAQVSAPVSDDDKDHVAGAQRIKVITDVLDMEIDSKGGDILRTVLRDYSVTAEKPEEKLVLMTDENFNYYVAQSGLVSVNKGTAPSHNVVYRSEQSTYRLAEGTDTIEVPLYWQGEDGTKIKKVLTFKRGDYVVGVKYHITAGNQDWIGSDYMQIVRSRPVETNGNAFIHTYTGGVVYNDEIKYEKYDFDDIAEQNLSYQLKDGWLAMIQHYFLSAWIPETSKENYYFSRYNRGKDHYTIGTRTSATTVEAGQTGVISSRFVVGPKLQNELEEIAPGLDLTVDYGILTIFAKPLFWLLDAFYQLFGNWGWAIIFLTITVKAVFYKLSEMS